MCFFFNFNCRIIVLQFFVCFCCVSTWIRHRYTYAPSLLNLSPTSQPIPTLFIVTEFLIWTPCILQRISIGFLFLHYMFPCYSLNSSHHLLPQLCPQVSSLCLHLHCCPAHQYYLSRFHIHMLVYNICFSSSDLFHSV